MLYIDRIKQFRQENNISQAQMARTLGMTQQQYFKYEKGINEMPVRYLLMICETYGLSADWLLGLSDKK
jgi:transcriptional regulator with XRE-family HTH domain